MIDSFCFWRQCLLAVVALLRFVGCNFTAPAANAPQVTFDPPGGAYDVAQMVTLSDPDPGATIYYTTDGSTPLAPDNPGGPSPQYNGQAIPVLTNIDDRCHSLQNKTTTTVRSRPRLTPSPQLCSCRIMRKRMRLRTTLP